MIKIVPVFITWRKVLQICPVFLLHFRIQNCIGF